MMNVLLVVDSDPDILRLVEHKLRPAGFEVLTALDGERGLALAMVKRPTVLLAEALLPGLDGLSLVAETRRLLGPTGPVAILLSESEQEADIAAALASGADDYVLKPFSPRELITRIAVARARARLHAPAGATRDIRDPRGAGDSPEWNVAPSALPVLATVDAAQVGDGR
jgi:two-component system alkaline phosphatase synthesis response regulator PhoP